MIDAAYVQRMARYNRWQNENLYGAAGALSDEERRRDRGAFFGSIHGTLSHLLWGDRIWMHRFAGWPKPDGGIKESPSLVPGWDDLKRARSDSDSRLIAWADGIDPDWLAGKMTYFSGAIGKEVTKPMWLLVTHLFNHQTHHRGQVHAMLTQAGAKPHDTDLPFMPE
ncbi:MAG: DinB family protein [Pseudolabrys sp.]